MEDIGNRGAMPINAENKEQQPTGDISDLMDAVAVAIATASNVNDPAVQALAVEAERNAMDPASPVLRQAARTAVLDAIANNRNKVAALLAEQHPSLDNIAKMLENEAKAPQSDTPAPTHHEPQPERQHVAAEAPKENQPRVASAEASEHSVSFAKRAAATQNPTTLGI